MSLVLLVCVLLVYNIIILQLTSFGVPTMEEVVVQYILTTISVLEMKGDLHSVRATMKQYRERTVTTWEFIADQVYKPVHTLLYTVKNSDHMYAPPFCHNYS